MNAAPQASEPTGDGLERLAADLGHAFADHDLLRQALTHRSFAAEARRPNGTDNEKLEFLGDAVLGLVIGAMLMREFPAMREGELSRVRAGLVREKQLAAMAEAISLGEHLLLGRGEEATGGRAKASILGSAYEALFGAVFSDRGYEAAHAVAERHFLPVIRSPRLQALDIDYKTKLQELTQARFGEIPRYSVVGTEGPEHARLFTVSVHCQGRVLAMASAGGRKAAEQAAAVKALEILQPSAGSTAAASGTR